MAAAATTANKSPQQHEQQQHRRQQHLQWSACILIVVLGLFSMLAGNCVNGQIDGYTAGEDYPAYDAVPKGLAFNCQGRQPGYYADTETRCQVWHWCLHSGHQYSFLCPNGTVFNQAVRVCDWWMNVNCEGSEQLYQNNDELYRIPERQQQLNEV
ncbi:U-scoloptoxin(01)-Cw1a [Drosophila ficusphila]|uniref:U-scoloptoxin(01)-Cw1a n=1 Tax=Drosophila ficusphila TaxID=30025 RepID=UPI001C890457|nr:U-scoloptoxin(01)-Cw1a [Drosophila ficusphila]